MEKQRPQNKPGCDIGPLKNVTTQSGKNLGKINIQSRAFFFHLLKTFLPAAACVRNTTTTSEVLRGCFCSWPDSNIHVAESMVRKRRAGFLKTGVQKEGIYV